MASRLRRLWDGYRHFRAAEGLVQDILAFLGWKMALVAAIIALGTWVRALLSHLAGVEQFVLSLAAFAATLLIVNLVLRVSGANLPRLSSASSSRLEFGLWHGGDSNRYPRKLNNGCPSWVSVRNVNTAAPRTASNVVAQIEWIDAERSKRLVVPEADWYFIEETPGGGRAESWLRSVDLQGGDDQSFVLFVQDEQSRRYIYKHGTELVGMLGEGLWTANIRVSSDNAEGFEGTLTLTVTRGGLTPGSPKAFVLRHRVRPRL
jgi:hypothetical protein